MTTDLQTMRVTPSIQRFYIYAISTLICLLAAPAALTQDVFSSGADDFLPVEQAYTVDATLDGDTVKFLWHAEPGYYLYRHQFSLTAKSPVESATLDFDIPDGLRKYDEIFQEELEVYYGSVEISATPPDFDGPFELQLSSQGCADAGLCYPPRTQFFSVIDGVITETPQSTVVDVQNTANQNLTNSGTPVDGTPTTAPATSASSLLLVILGAALGGMILNLMPCVFPVLSLKALHLASGSAAQHRINGWAYTAGVTLSFVAVGAVIIFAKSAGTTLGWGFQLQQPAFVAALIYLFLILSLNLFGLFEIGTSWMGVGQTLTQGDGVTASFFTGVLAAVVASPCTAPFMATAIGYTLTQGPVITMIVFISLGLGMALPYLALSHSPHIARRLPSPGPWMDTFKQFLAFPLLFTCVWLLVVLGNQTSAYSAGLIVGGGVGIAMGFWLLKKQPGSGFKWLCRILAITLFAVAAKIALDTQQTTTSLSAELEWQPYSAEKLADLRASNTPVFIDLTADWCITCKINEKVAINVDEVLQFAQTNNIVLLQGDWTRPDPEITELLHRFNRNGVPLYLMYGSDGKSPPEILPQLLTPGIVLDAMQRSL